MLYDIKVKQTDGTEKTLAEYKGKVLLIVNTATGCGFTPQYEGLAKLYDEYKDRGFEILDFPCNQFFEQAPGTNEELKSFCQMKYNTKFETFAKIDVNGENTSDLYLYLRREAQEAEEDDAARDLYKLLEGKGFTTSGDEIKWNFTKFLIDKEGRVFGRFAPSYPPEELKDKIEELLNMNY